MITPALVRKFLYAFIALTITSFIHWKREAIFRLILVSDSPEARIGVEVIVGLLFWLSVGFFIRQLIHLLFRFKYTDRESTPPAPQLIKEILIILLYFVIAAIILNQVFHQPLTGIWATSGALALVIGFALRNILVDLFSGVAMNLEKPYQIGDWIEVHQKFSSEKIIGQVTDLNWRATHVRTEMGSNMIIPNGMMATLAVITNYWHAEKDTRYEISFTIDFSVPPSRVKRVLQAGAVEAQRSQGFVSEKLPEILIEETNAMGTVYTVRYWITPWHGISPSRARDQVHHHILNHMYASGLTPAYPKEDVFHSTMPARQLDTMTATDRASLLSRLDIFSVLTDDERVKISEHMVRRKFMRGSYIVRQGESGNSMFLLFEGLLAVVLDQEGQKVKLANLSPTEYFGEMSLLTGESRTASVLCESDCVVFEISKQDLLELVKEREEIINLLAGHVAERRLQNMDTLEKERVLAANGNSEKMSQTLVSRIKRFFNS